MRNTVRPNLANARTVAIAVPEMDTLLVAVLDGCRLGVREGDSVVTVLGDVDVDGDVLNVDVTEPVRLEDFVTEGVRLMVGVTEAVTLKVGVNDGVLLDETQFGLAHGVHTVDPGGLVALGPQLPLHAAVVKPTVFPNVFAGPA